MKITVSTILLLLFLSMASIAHAQERVDPDPTYRERVKQEAIRAKEEAKRAEEEAVKAAEEAAIRAREEAVRAEKERIRAKANEYMKLQKPFATFSDATGWTRCTPTPIWIDKKNTISEFDNFDRLEFGWTVYDGVRYLYYNKINSFSYFWRDSKSGRIESAERMGNKNYIIDYDEYKVQVDSLSDTDNVITLSVLNYYCSGTDKPAETIYMGNKEMGQVDNSSAADKLVIKFRINKAKNTARFLVYYMNGSTISYKDSFQTREKEFSFSEQMEEVINPRSTLSLFQGIISSNELYENFYYEAAADKFLEFIKAPLRQK